MNSQAFAGTFAFLPIHNPNQKNQKNQKSHQTHTLGKCSHRATLAQQTIDRKKGSTKQRFGKSGGSVFRRRICG